MGDLRELHHGLGYQLDVDGSVPLAELTESLNRLCERVEDRTKRTVVMLRLGTAANGSRSWPGNVCIQDVNRWERAVRRLQRLSAANIAVAGGACGGPGLDLLLAADFRICARGMRLLLPVNDGHFWPGMAVYWLVQQLGIARARQIVLWSDEVSADTAREFGLIDQITDDVEEAVQHAAVLMGRISDTELAIRRQLLMEAASVSFEEALGAHLSACDRELRRLRDVANLDVDPPR